jgi:hypothetical protein
MPLCQNDSRSAPLRRSARHPSSSEEGSSLIAPLLIQEGWRLGRRGGYPREGVFPQPAVEGGPSSESGEIRILVYTL